MQCIVRMAWTGFKPIISFTAVAKTGRQMMRGLPATIVCASILGTVPVVVAVKSEYKAKDPLDPVWQCWIVAIIIFTP